MLLSLAQFLTASKWTQECRRIHVGMLKPRGLTLYAPNLSVVSTETAKQWRLLYKSTPEVTVPELTDDIASPAHTGSMDIAGTIDNTGEAVSAELANTDVSSAEAETTVSTNLPAGTESPVVTGGASDSDTDLNNSTPPSAEAETTVSTGSATNTGSDSTVNLNTSNAPVVSIEPATQPALVNIPPVTTASGLSLFTAFSLKLSELNSAISREEIATRLQQAGITTDNNMIDSYHGQIT